jgi:fatty acid desaturase
VAPDRPVSDAASVAPRRADAVSGAAIAAHAAAVLAPVYLAAWVGPGWSTVVFWLWFGLFSQGLLLVLHECVHELTFRRISINEAVARWVFAPLFFTDFEAFRKRHWAHHREIGRDSDPKYTYRTDITGWAFVRLAVETLTLIGALRRVFYQSGEQSGATAASTRVAVAALALGQTVVLVTLIAVARLGHPESWTATVWSSAVAYGVVYVYGLASLTVLVHALRGIAEHRRCSDGEPVDGDAALRNFTSPLLARWIFGTYGFCEHATHHRFPAVPYYQLPELTRRSASTNPDLSPVGSHFEQLRRLVSGNRQALHAPQPNESVRNAG